MKPLVSPASLRGGRRGVDPGGTRSRRRRLDRWLTALVRTGGLAVIAAITTLLLYLIWVAAPLLDGADWGQASSQPIAGDAVLALRESEDGLLWLFRRDGVVQRLEATSGRPLDALATPDAAALAPVAGREDVVLFVGRDDVARLYGLPARSVSAFGKPLIVAPAGRRATAGWASAASALLIALDSDGLRLHRYRSAPGDAWEPLPLQRLRLDGDYRRVLLDGQGRRAYLFAADGRLRVLQIPRRGPAQLLATAGSGVTAPVALLPGGAALLAGQRDAERHRLSQWTVTPANRLVAIRHFDFAAPLQLVETASDGRSFLAVTSEGDVHLLHSTTGRWLQTRKLAGEPMVLAGALTRNAVLLATADGQLRRLPFDNPHPEAALSTLWQPVWYEGYPQPEWVWQSSSADDDFEPKFSLVPLTLGTLKAAFYALLIATPIALCGAVYTAYFMRAENRRLVKPGIEMMAALPTVVLGFLAAQWLAPRLERHLLGLALLPVVLTALALLAAWVDRRLPARLRRRLRGRHMLAGIALALLGAWLAFALGQALLPLLPGADVRTWLEQSLSIDYSQRNALLVGIAMGLAVIPVIFSLAEDAISGVPRHLSNGALALGATQWQTLIKVVLLTASPGIFSALMIGFGRAMGETMIVLMATGNTPILDWSPLSGMRTLAANIVIELPESEVNSTHYRILILSALLLFAATFLFNSIAELIRQRLRLRYGSL